MLGVFSERVAKAPQELSNPTNLNNINNNNANANTNCNANGNSRLSGEEMLNGFVSQQPDAFQTVMSSVGVAMAFSKHNQALLSPRSFCVVDGIFCMFEGQLSNLGTLRHDYGLAKNVNEVMLIIEAYKALRDRGPFPTDQVLSSLAGHFAFILFDANNNSLFVAVDREGKVGLYWGSAADGTLVFSNNADILKAGCGASFAPFPPGCYFSSNMGLQSFEHPLQKLSPVPRVNSQGHALGATFKVDPLHKNISTRNSMNRVGSEADWSQSI